MNKSFSAVLAVAVLILGLSVFFASCGGGGGGSSTPGNTTISTPSQGAQSATASVSTFRSMSNASSSLTGMTGVGGLVGGNVAVGPSSTAAEKFAARFTAVAKKAKAMRSSTAGAPQTSPCYGGGSMTTDMDAAGTSMTMTFSNCKEGVTLTDGTIAWSGITQTSNNSGSGNITIGSDAHPFIETTYSSSTSTVINEVTTAVVTMGFTATGTSQADMSFTMNINGQFDDVDHVAHTHENQVMTNFSYSGGFGSTTIGSTSYDVVTATVNGTVSGTTYASDTDATISYQEGGTFTNVTIVDKQPVFGTGDEYLSINGTISISTTPTRCIDGTFSIVTNTDLQIDGVTGQTKAGRITINGNAVATFNSDGSVTVSVDGGAALTYTRAALDTMCAL